MTQTATPRVKVVHTWNYKKGNDIGVIYDDENGVRSEGKMSVDWYFTIKKEDEERAMVIVSESHSGTVAFLDDPKYPGYVKIHPRPTGRKEEIFSVTRGRLVMTLEKNGIETFEGDLMPDKRWFIDKEVIISDKYRKLYFDIETDDTEQRIEIGRDRILSFAAMDDTGKMFFKRLKEHTDEAETNLMLDFLKVIKDYNILLGWNSSGFDVPYLKKRMQKYDLHFDKAYCWKKMGHFDLLKRFRHIFRFDSHIKSFSLENISQHFLGKGKVKHDEKIIELWRDNPKKLKVYNEEDVRLLFELDQKLGVSDMMIRQSQWCGVPVSQFGLYSIIDSFILKTAHQVNKFARTAVNAIKERVMDNTRGNENPDDTGALKKEEEVNDDDAQYMGAIVLEPVVGKYDRVYTFDFKSLYPSMMRTSNIGYDSLRYVADDNCIINPGTLSIERKVGGIKPTYFVKEPSVVNLAVSGLLKKREEYKKLKLKMIEEGLNKGTNWEMVVSDEIIVKELANSTYGIMGLKYGRYFSVDVAESITLFGQWCIMFAKGYYESIGYKVIYGDTDSVFVATGKGFLDVDGTLEGFHSALRKELKEKFNIDECFIQLNFDKQYESFVLIAKKTYVGHVINMEGKKTNEIYARGMDFIKKNTFGFAAEKQKFLINKVLYDAPDVEDMKKVMQDIKKEFYDKEFTREELTIIQKVGKEPESYAKTQPLHVKLAALVKANNGESMKNVEIEYIVTGKDKTIDGILAEHFTGEYDRNYYWENKTRKILERITKVAYPDIDFFPEDRPVKKEIKEPRMTNPRKSKKQLAIENETNTTKTKTEDVGGSVL